MFRARPGGLHTLTQIQTQTQTDADADTATERERERERRPRPSTSLGRLSRTFFLPALVVRFLLDLHKGGFGCAPPPPPPAHSDGQLTRSAGCRVWVSGFRVSAYLGLRVSGLGFRV